MVSATGTGSLCSQRWNVMLIRPPLATPWITTQTEKAGWLGRLLSIAREKAVDAFGLRASLAELVGELQATELRQESGRTGDVKPQVEVYLAPLGIEFVSVPAGEFTMGSSGGMSDEQPPHRVVISEPFQMSRNQVTQGQWKALMGSNPSYFNTNESLPVESVSWHDAQQFVARANAELNDGCSYRLPTEAEWEFACRAGTEGDYAGSLQDMAWYGANSGGKTHPVGQKKPNVWGLHDMHGNLWEWVEDWYGSRYYLKSATTDPQGPPSGTYRVIRGGAWIIGSNCCRSSHRDGRWPGNRSYYVGFRLVRSPA